MLFEFINANTFSAMATLNEKIRNIISVYKLSDRQFAIKIGVTQSVIGSMFQKGTEPSAKVIKNTLAAFPEISSDWFLRDIGEENIPEDYNFYELKAAENKIEEYALVSNIIMGSDRYFYVELPHPSNLINIFVKIIENEHGEIVEKSSTELVAKMPSKNDAIRVGVEIIGIGLERGVDIISAVGMTGAASIERSIDYTNEVGKFPGIAFTKLGGEYALVFDSPFKLRKSSATEYQNYLFIDLIDSTKFISKNGRLIST